MRDGTRLLDDVEATERTLNHIRRLQEALEWCEANEATVKFHRPVGVRITLPGPADVGVFVGATLIEAMNAAKEWEAKRADLRRTFGEEREDERNRMADGSDQVLLENARGRGVQPPAGNAHVLHSPPADRR